MVPCAIVRLCHSTNLTLLLHAGLTLEAHCSTLVVEPSFLHNLSSKQFDSADHEMANFVALARSDYVHSLIELRFAVYLVVHHHAGKKK